VTDVKLGKGFTVATFTTESIQLEDCWSGARPKIIDTIESESLALSFKFESNEAMTVTPFNLELRTQRTLVVFANMPFIKEVKRSILGALDGEHLNFAFYTDAAAKKALAYMDQGREFVESLRTGAYKH